MTSGNGCRVNEHRRKCPICACRNANKREQSPVGCPTFMKLSELAGRMGYTERQVRRMAVRSIAAKKALARGSVSWADSSKLRRQVIPGHRLTKGGHHRFTECQTLNAWIKHNAKHERALRRNGYQSKQEKAFRDIGANVHRLGIAGNPDEFCLKAARWFNSQPPIEDWSVERQEAVKECFLPVLRKLRPLFPVIDTMFPARFGAMANQRPASAGRTSSR